MTLADKDLSQPRIILPRAGMISSIILVAALLALVVFRQFPGIDFYFSDIFFNIEPCSSDSLSLRCGRFPLAREEFWLGLRNSGYYLPQVLMLLFVVWLAWLSLFDRQKSYREISVPIIAICSAIIGPGIITNIMLKEFWGRPRPFMTVSFGGDHPFVPPGDITSFCSSNCSFVSGEATAAFWLVVVCLYLTGRKRMMIFAGICALAAAISFLRVVFGRHFFSDIVIAASIGLLSVSVSCWLIQTKLVSNWISRFVRHSNRTAWGIPGKRD